MYLFRGLLMVTLCVVSSELKCVAKTAVVLQQSMGLFFALILEKITVQLFILWFPYGDLMSCVMLIEDVSRPIVMLRSNFILGRRLDCINAIPRA